MDRMTSMGRRIRRGSLLVVLAVALVAALMPTAAFASGRDSRPTYSYNRYARQNPHNQRNYQYDNNRGRYDRNQYQYDYDRYDRYDNDKYDYKHHDAKPSYKHCATTYRVRRGDTLSEIARHYRTSVYSLAKANGIRNANRIIAGQVLCIP